jgi:phosphoribosylanthranilate isomerase
MVADVKVKICGLRTEETVQTAVKMGADYIGFVFFAKSPRFVTPSQNASLAVHIPAEVTKVGLVVDADDVLLENIMSKGAIDMLQLQGKETPARVAEIKAKTGLPVMKALGVSDERDLAALEAYIGIADQLLIDAKPPKGAELPGGNGLAFDWTLLKGATIAAPWMLAGGLTPDNVATALLVTGARQVDVSTGVERKAGEKDIAKMTAFIKNAKSKPSQ